MTIHSRNWISQHVNGTTEMEVVHRGDNDDDHTVQSKLGPDQCEVSGTDTDFREENFPDYQYGD